MTIISRQRLSEICTRLSTGADPATLPEVADSGDGHATLADGTRLTRTPRGTWTYRGWSRAGRHMDRVRPDDADPAAIMSRYGNDLGVSPDTIAGRCYSCGQPLPSTGSCPC